MPQRPYTLADAPSKPSIWADVQDASTVTYDASTLRVTNLAMKGTAGGSFTPRVAAKSPKYNATGIDGLPGLAFILSEQGLLNTTVNGPAQPATVVYVWKEAATLPGSGYGVLVDHAKEATGDRYTLFNAYGGANVGLEGRSGGTSGVVYVSTGGAASRTNILVVEYNGANSRSYINGAVIGRNLRPSLSGAGIAIGGKLGDSFFGGLFGELAIIPEVYGPGDAWDRLTQSLMWKWGQQAKIADGATYKDAAPMVDDGALATVTGAASATLLGVVATSAATLAIVAASAFALNVVGSNASSLAPISAQAQGPLGAVGSAGAGGISVVGAGSALLSSVSTTSAGTLPLRATGATVFGVVSGSAASTAPIAAASSATLDVIGTVSTARADVRAAATVTLGTMGASSTVGGQSLATASGASVLGSVSTASAGSVPIIGNGLNPLATIASNSGTASTVQGAGAASPGSIISTSAGTLPLGARGTTALGTVVSNAQGASSALGSASSELAAIVSGATATVGQDTDGQLVGPGWSLTSARRIFEMAPPARIFIVISTGRRRMQKPLRFPLKYAAEVRHAAIDFSASLAPGEQLTGDPIVEVAKGDLVASNGRIDGATVRFTLAGGSKAEAIVQSVEVRCSTSGGQVLEELVLVQMGS